MQTQKRKRGRPVGGVSFVTVSVADILQKYGEKASIPVSRVWLESAEASHKFPAKIKQEPAVLSTTPQPSVEMQLVN